MTPLEYREETDKPALEGRQTTTARAGIDYFE